MCAAVVMLESGRVRLREHRLEDHAAVLGYSADEAVARYVPWEPNTYQAARAFLDSAIAAADQTPRISYELAMVERDTDLLVGAARIGIESIVHKRADLGFVLRRDRWGEGLATEAARLLLGFGFDQLAMHRISATCHPDNGPSAHVLEKIGMSYEGRVRGHLLVKGAWRDSLSYAVVEPEWRALSNA
jgi:RimJ/RimL family protein N-acetyltransferase